MGIVRIKWVNPHEVLRPALNTFSWYGSTWAFYKNKTKQNKYWLGISPVTSTMLENGNTEIKRNLFSYKVRINEVEVYRILISVCL